MRVVSVRNITIGEGTPQICIPIVGRNDREIMDQAKNLLSYPCDLVEFRGDWYEGLLEEEGLLHILTLLRKTLGRIPLLFTVRTSVEGGEISVGEEDYGRILLFAARSGLVDLIDVEAFSGENSRQDLIAHIQEAGVPVILSSHDFEKTPGEEEMVERLRTMQDLGGDIVKLAVMPGSARDVLNLLFATLTMKEKYARVPLVTMSMSHRGMISRICGELTGSAITFGTAGTASAPGQIEARELDRLLTLFSQEKMEKSCK